MAIKTKKISELGQIDVDNVDILKKSDFYFLGCMAGVTGKVSTSDVLTAIRANVEEFDFPHQNSKITKLENETSNLKESVTNIQGKIDTVVNREQELEMIQTELTELKNTVYGTNGSDLGQNFHNFDLRIDALDARITSLEMESKKESNTAAVYTRTDSCDCSKQIASLENKVAALEGFVKALQEDGYLTLAKIKQAAAEHCPICNPSHELEQPTE